MTEANGKRARLEELLVTRAVEGLDTPEALELEELLGTFDGVDPQAFDEAAAVFWLAANDAWTPLPDDVADRLKSSLAGATGGDDSRVVSLKRAAGPPRRPEPSQGPQAAAASRTGNRWAWLATAAALVLAIAGWWPQLSDDRAEPETVNLAQERDRLLAEAPDAVQVEWEATEHPRAEGVMGHVVWSESEQRGYMTFRDIPDNDPSRHQYQLWLFDGQRSEQYPVDGGVFDAPASAEEVVIPIRNQLPVKQAELFAVTLEEPGGVVVSDRDPILWIAETEQAPDT